jgi:hypothetical protein
VIEDRNVTVLAENRVPVEWSQEAARLDPQNPYRPKPQPESGTDVDAGPEMEL